MRGLESAAGSVTQVREVGHRLTASPKETDTPVVIVGHVTKEGFNQPGRACSKAPVDTVLFFAGDRSHAYRVLRATRTDSQHQ